jgi:hypothetical protein
MAATGVAISNVPPAPSALPTEELAALQHATMSDQNQSAARFHAAPIDPCQEFTCRVRLVGSRLGVYRPLGAGV